jgi:hypothetical protein
LAAISLERDIMPWATKPKDATQRIFKLPKDECELSQWRTAIERLMLLGDRGAIRCYGISQQCRRCAGHKPAESGTGTAPKTRQRLRDRAATVI